MISPTDLLIGFKEIFSAPLRDPSVLWLLAPTVSLWLILEIYFEFHKSEQLGWNTALGNGVSLCWIVIGLLKNAFEGYQDYFKITFLILLLIYSILIIYISFTHKLSAKITYTLASPTLVYFLSSVAVLYTYGLLVPSLPVIIDLLIILGLAVLIIQAIKRFTPEEFEAESEPPEIGELKEIT